MSNPLYDHDLDARPPHPEPPHAADAAGPKGKKHGKSSRPARPRRGLATILATHALGAALAVLAAWALLLLVAFVAFEFGPDLIAPPFVGTAWLAFMAALAAVYVRWVRSRLRRLLADKTQAATPTPVFVLAALGLSGGTIPATLRLMIALGLYGGLAMSLASALALQRGLRASPGDEGRRIVLLGPATVRGFIERIDSSGPFELGSEGEADGSLSSGGSLRQPPGVRGWVRIGRHAAVTGDDLEVEMQGPGLAFLGRPLLRRWLFADVTSLALGLLLVLGCATAASGRTIGYVLLSTWAVACLGLGALLADRLPVGVAPTTWPVLLYPALLLVVLLRPGVRAYLGRLPHAKPRPVLPNESSDSLALAA